MWKFIRNVSSKVHKYGDSLERRKGEKPILWIPYVGIFALYLVVLFFVTILSILVRTFRFIF